uniref:Uncharacterized protein n=1 Tax=Anguilla anguilla TaxID=7936 RepID=A0A0E9SPE2_ANGAN
MVSRKMHSKGWVHCAIKLQCHCTGNPECKNRMLTRLSHCSH